MAVREFTRFVVFFFFSSRRRHTRFKCDWSSDVCSSDLVFGYRVNQAEGPLRAHFFGISLSNTVKHHCQAVPQRGLVRKAVVSSLFTFMYFRSSTHRRFPLQFDLIVINGGTDEIF